MKKIQGFVAIMGVIVKYAGVAMVIIETIEFFNNRLNEKLGDIKEVPEPSKNLKDGAVVSE